MQLAVYSAVCINKHECNLVGGRGDPLMKTQAAGGTEGRHRGTENQLPIMGYRRSFSFLTTFKSSYTENLLDFFMIFII